MPGEQRPIDEAKKDGTRYLLWCERVERVVLGDVANVWMVGHWDGERWIASTVDYYDMTLHPTLFVELEAPIDAE